MFTMFFGDTINKLKNNINQPNILLIEDQLNDDLISVPSCSKEPSNSQNTNKNHQFLTNNNDEQIASNKKLLVISTRLGLYYINFKSFYL